MNVSSRSSGFLLTYFALPDPNYNGVLDCRLFTFGKAKSRLVRKRSGPGNGKCPKEGCAYGVQSQSFTRRRGVCRDQEVVVAEEFNREA